MRRPLVLIACLLAVIVGLVAVFAYLGREPEAGSPAPSLPPPTPLAAFTVVDTWDEGDGVGAGAQITVPTGVPDAAREGVKAFLRSGWSSGYMFVEAVNEPGAEEWVCAGERLVVEADRELAVFTESQAAASFPFEWVTCR